MPAGPSCSQQKKDNSLMSRKNLSTSSLPFGRLLEDPVGNIINVIRSKFFTKGGHRIFAVGDLGLDGVDIVTSKQVLLKRFFFDLLLGDNAVVTTSMAGCTVGTENSFTVFQVRCQCRAAACHSCQKAQCKAQG